MLNCGMYMYMYIRNDKERKKDCTVWSFLDALLMLEVLCTLCWLLAYDAVASRKEKRRYMIRFFVRQSAGFPCDIV